MFDEQFAAITFLAIIDVDDIYLEQSTDMVLGMFSKGGSQVLRTAHLKATEEGKAKYTPPIN